MTPSRFMGLPRGSRDLLPPAARRRRDLLRTLLQTFERWGYAQVVTPTVEYYDVLAEGLSEADRRLCVRFIEAHSGDLVALRADLTPQIARMVAGRRAAGWPSDAVTRLCYAADVVRQPAGDREQTEYHQAGVELIGDRDPAADAELVALAHEALERVGLPRFRFDVSHRAVAGGVIDGLALAPEDRATLAQLLARKDRGSVIELLRARAVPQRALEAAAALCDLFGPAALHEADQPSAIDRARAVLANATSASGLAELEAMLDHLHHVHPEAAAAVDVDLGEVRGFDYYSGFRLRVWAPGVERPVLRGGRYDDLFARYGAPAPATGFAIDLDALEMALPDDAGDDPTPARVIAVHPAVDATAGRLEAARHGAAARREGERAWVQPAVELARAQELAAWWGARALTFIDQDGDALRVACHRRDDDGWAGERRE